MTQKLRITWARACAAFMAVACVLWLTPRPSLAADGAAPGIVVLGAASLTDVLTSLGSDFEKASGIPVKLSFAASSALARQIENGAPADVFVSADVDWMDYLQTRQLIKRETRRDLLGNRLVLIASATSAVALKIGPKFPLLEALGAGRLATGDPDSVPAGRYAHSALSYYGVWDSVSSRIVGAESVRAALAYVDRGEAVLGIVYETDARIDKGVRIVDTFPAVSHAPIVYPIALTATANTSAQRFEDYLRSSPAKAAFLKSGFTPLP